MRHILLVAATALEVRQILQWATVELSPSGEATFERSGYRVTLRVTGIGPVNTAFGLGQFLARTPPDLAINLGIAGGISRDLALEEVVEVRAESWPDFGAMQGARFLDLRTIGFPSLQTEAHQHYNTLPNPTPPATDLRPVTGWTRLEVTGERWTLHKLLQRYPAEVETMEGAAFFHACLAAEVPFAAFRGISNRVADRTNWRLQEAATAVQRYVWANLTAIASGALADSP